MKLVFASGNKHKLEEIRSMLPSNVELFSMQAMGFYDEIEETGNTLEENAKIKAVHIANKVKESCFADDSGLEVDFLDGAPGVYSARYAGPACTYTDNNVKLLGALMNESNRKARFRTVIHLVLDGKHHSFEGIVNGEITTSMIGNQGFGYDPIFKPDGYDKTFGEMTPEEKNLISHRARALEKLADFISSL